MIIIADSGSTKTDWCILSPSGDHHRFLTTGLNPFFMNESELLTAVRSQLVPHMDNRPIKKVFFYGAGCQGDKMIIMERVFQQIFPAAARIEVRVDLLAAAKALLGDTPGFAAILGTGTNTCLYDGNHISCHIDSLGFLLGDEGSGAAIGKKILVDFLRKRLPDKLHSLFIHTYGRNETEMISEVYASSLPNRFCASFAKFLDAPDMDQDYLYEVVKGSFHTFFSQLVCLYPDYRDVSFNCVGSIAYRFADILREEVLFHGMPMGRILPSVIGELALYHEKDLWDSR